MKEFVGPRAKKWTIIRNIKKRKEQKKVCNIKKTYV